MVNMKIHYLVLESDHVTIVEEGVFISFKGSPTQQNFAARCQTFWEAGCAVVTWKVEEGEK